MFSMTCCRSIVWDVRLKVLLIWLEENKEEKEKGSLINQFILKQCLCHYLVPAAEWHSNSRPILRNCVTTPQQ